MDVVRMFSVFSALLVGAAFVAAAVFVVGVRARSPRVLRFARAMQRDMVNPRALRNAGGAGSPWAVVRAPGRVSGRVYDTPVGVQRVGDELYISLPYGEGTQWLRNVADSHWNRSMLQRLSFRCPMKVSQEGPPEPGR